MKHYAFYFGYFRFVVNKGEELNKIAGNKQSSW